MTKEEKELLTKVLCEQLPYGVFVKENRFSLDDGHVIYTPDYHPYIHDCKPYLRPLSSITKEEVRALFRVIYPAYHVTKVIIKEDCIKYIAVDNEFGNSGRLTIFFDNPKICNLAQLDWFFANHFDVRGLIPKGLAIAAVGKDNPYKEKGGEE